MECSSNTDPHDPQRDNASCVYIVMVVIAGSITMMLKLFLFLHKYLNHYLMSAIQLGTNVLVFRQNNLTSNNLGSPVALLCNHTTVLSCQMM